MHELSVTQNIVEIAVERAVQEGFNKVKSVSLEIGKMSGVMPEAVEFCYDLVTKGTIAEGSQLNIEIKEAVGYCKECRIRFNSEYMFYLCPECEGVDIEFISGKELKIKDMEVE